MYSIIDVYHEALSHQSSAGAESDEERFCLYKGIKIQLDKLTNVIRIFNTTIGGDYYKEIKEDEYDIFLENGWKIGVLCLSLTNYKRKLQLINTQIQLTLNNHTRVNSKYYHNLKESRSRYLSLYAKTTNQLNLIK